MGWLEVLVVIVRIQGELELLISARFNLDAHSFYLENFTIAPVVKLKKSYDWVNHCSRN